MRKIAVYIADQQHSRLKALAISLGVTQAELLRRFLEEGLLQAEQERERRTRFSSAPRGGADV
jgi:predicted DNA-binding protein